MRRQGQRGAALLLAVMVAALVVSAAAGMVWLQTRAVHVEAAQRARDQAAWILLGATDWARLLLREDLRSARQSGKAVDALDEPWATRLEEARLSSFLAADRDNSAGDAGPEAFISGAITDAQARWNLRNLVGADGSVQPAQVAALQRLADLAGSTGDTGARIATALAAALAAPGSEGAVEASAQPLAPERVADLAWLGIDAATIQRLAPWVELLPLATPVNANTAPREVLVAAIDGLDLGSAERLVQARQRKAFESLADVQALLAADVKADAARVAVNSSWFVATGRLRLDDRVLEERTLLQRDDARVHVRRRERQSSAAADLR